MLVYVMAESAIGKQAVCGKPSGQPSSFVTRISASS